MWLGLMQEGCLHSLLVELANFNKKPVAGVPIADVYYTTAFLGCRGVMQCTFRTKAGLGCVRSGFGGVSQKVREGKV